MWGQIATKLVVYMLRHASLTNEQRQLLTATLLDRLGALPLHARIMVDESGEKPPLVDGRPLTLDMARKLQDGARSINRNFTRRYVRATMRHMAIQIGVHQNESPDQGMFAKAALWVMQEEDKIYSALAGEGLDD